MDGGLNMNKHCGYYWVRLFNHINDPQIIYLSEWSGVLVIGSRERYSSYYDVKEWISGPLDLDKINV